MRESLVVLAEALGSLRGVKRTSEDLHAMSQRLVSFKDLALPIRKLVADGVLTSKGNKRSTVYFPGRKALKNQGGRAEPTAPPSRGHVAAQLVRLPGVQSAATIAA